MNKIKQEEYEWKVVVNGLRDYWKTLDDKEWIN